MQGAPSKNKGALPGRRSFRDQDKEAAAQETRSNEYSCARYRTFLKQKLSG